MALLIGCSCDTGNGNTGLPNCFEKFTVSRGFGVQYIQAKDGTPNRINLSVASITTEFSSLFTHDDISKRIYPIRDLKNVDFPKEETQFVTDNQNQKAFLRDGVQSVSAEVWEVPPAYDIKLKQMRCPRNGIWSFTREGVVGLKRQDLSDGNFYFYPSEVKAFAPSYMLPKGDGIAKEIIQFDIDITVEIGELWLVPWADIGMDYEDAIGLLDVDFIEQTAPVDLTGTTTAEYRLISDFGTGLINGDKNVDALVTADFTATNITTGLAVAAFSATEVLDDKYTFSYSSETPGHIIEIKMNLASGYEGKVRFTQP